MGCWRGGDGDVVEAHPPQPPPKNRPPLVGPESLGAHLCGRPPGRNGAVVGTRSPRGPRKGPTLVRARVARAHDP